MDWILPDKYKTLYYNSETLKNRIDCINLYRTNLKEELTHLGLVRRRFKQLEKCWYNKRRSKIIRIKLILDSIIYLLIEESLEEQHKLINPKKNKLNISEYRYLCSFKLSEIPLNKVKGFNQLIKYGFYNKDNNYNGIVKDHRISIKYGYDNNINPIIIGHPANCEFLLFQDNLRKSFSCSIDLTSLINIIDKWN